MFERMDARMYVCTYIRTERSPLYPNVSYRRRGIVIWFELAIGDFFIFLCNNTLLIKIISFHI